MCRSIKTLRPPYTADVTDADVRAAALQYVRKISGFRAPAAHNAAAFEEAVTAVAHATAHLLDHLDVRGSSGQRLDHRDVGGSSGQRLDHRDVGGSSGRRPADAAS